jgi:serine/threonine-protein phosphatase 2A regulatory subunit A
VRKRLSQFFFLT